MKAQPTICVLLAVAAAGALLLGCEGGIQQLAPGDSSEVELIAAYVDPISPTPGSQRAGDNGDADKLPLVDGDPQDKEWNVAQPLYVYVSGEHGTGGRGTYVEMRAIWSDESRWGGQKNHLYMMIRYHDETEDILPDYWRYCRPSQYGCIPSPIPGYDGPGSCDSTVVEGANWSRENEGGVEDQLALMFEIEPASDDAGTYQEIGCQVLCHGGQFGGVPHGKLDVWFWRAGRTNAQRSTAYPDTTDINWNSDHPDGRPESFYGTALDPPTAWPAYMEDLSLDAAGLRQDAADPNYPFRAGGYSGQLWTMNEGTASSRDGQVIPRWITELVKDVREGTGGTQEEEVPPNGGLPTTLYLWGPSAQTFNACDLIATSRTSAQPKLWSQGLPEGETDVMPGYLLWIPNGGAADVRARGDHKNNATKRFPVWSVELRRPMVTQNANDVMLDPSQVYTFTIAIFDRSARTHSGSGPIRLRFQPSPYSLAAGTGRVQP